MSDYRSTSSLKATSKKPVSRDYDSQLDSNKRSMAMHDLNTKVKMNANEVKQRLDQINEHAHVHADAAFTAPPPNHSHTSNSNQHFMLYGYDMTIIFQRLMSMLSVIPILFQRMRSMLMEMYQGKRSFSQMIEPYRAQWRSRVYSWSSYFVNSCIMPYPSMRSWLSTFCERNVDIRALGSLHQPLSKINSKLTWSQLSSDSYWNSLLNIGRLSVGFLCFCALNLIGICQNTIIPFVRSESFQKGLRMCRAAIVSMAVMIFRTLRFAINSISDYINTNINHVSTSSTSENQTRSRVNSSPPLNARSSHKKFVDMPPQRPVMSS